MSQDLVRRLLERVRTIPDKRDAMLIAEAASLIEASAGNAEPEANDHAEAQFTEWFVKNYPGPDTVIHKPTWHAPKIFRAARHALRSATPQPASAPEAVCDVLTMKHSSGFPDYFSRVTVGDRSLTFFMSKIKGRCEYHTAELNWLLNGGEKPHILAFDDTEPEGLADYLKSIERSEASAPEAVKADRIVPSGLSMKDGAIFVSFDTDEEAQIAYDALEEGVPFVATLPRPAVSEAMVDVAFAAYHPFGFDAESPAVLERERKRMRAALQAALGGEEG